MSDRVDASQLQPGDLVFFDIANEGDATARPVGHVAVYLGNGMISQSTTLKEYWTLARSGDGWMVVSIEQDREGRHQLDEKIVAFNSQRPRQLSWLEKPRLLPDLAARRFDERCPAMSRQ